MSWLMHDAFAGEAAPAATAETAQVEVPQELTAEKMLQDNLMLLGLIFFIFYFMLIRPQQRRVKMHNEMMKGLKKGDKIVTSGGIIGSIIKFEGEDVVVMEVAPNIRIRVARAAIAEVKDNTGSPETANDN